MASHLLLLHALSPLHAGIGQGAGAIDLPIARDVATRRPLLPGSSCKGVLRETSRAELDDNDTRRLFGSDTTTPNEDGSMQAGAVQFGDARLLLFPARSLRGTFAWITCPDVLASVAREAGLCGVDAPSALPSLPQDGCSVWAPENEKSYSSSLTFEETGANEKTVYRVYLEDLELKARTNDADTREWARWCGKHLFPEDQWWRDEFKKRFCVVGADVFNFLVTTATDVRARNVLSESGKTTQNLWYEESLPAESVLWEFLNITPNGRTNLNPAQITEKLRALCRSTAQFGGKATVGHGLCQLRFIEAAPPAAQGGDDNAIA